MGKKKKGAPSTKKRIAKTVKPPRDHQIDFSEIPELSDRQLKSIKRLRRAITEERVREIVREELKKRA